MYESQNSSAADRVVLRLGQGLIGGFLKVHYSTKVIPQMQLMGFSKVRGVTYTQ